jgi:hypothetical protein
MLGRQLGDSLVPMLDTETLEDAAPQRLSAQLEVSEGY